MAGALPATADWEQKCRQVAEERAAAGEPRVQVQADPPRQQLPAEGGAAEPAVEELTAEQLAERAVKQEAKEVRMREQYAKLGVDYVDDGMTQNQRKKQIKLVRNELKWKEDKIRAKETKRMRSADLESRTHRTFVNGGSVIVPLDPEIEAIKEARRVEIKRLDREKRAAYLRSCEDGCSVVLDLGFDADMTEKERKSVVQQVMHCHGSNKKSKCPGRVHLTSVEGETEKGLLAVQGYPNWPGFTVSPEPYLDLFPKESLVYLTADSENVVHELDRGKVYIIGAIVDRNRLKDVTFQKAQAQGIATAKLPLGEEMKGASTPVLTINHVFNILLEFQACKSWGEAFQAVLPSRKRLLPVGAPSDDDDGGGGDDGSGAGGGGAGGAGGGAKLKPAKREARAAAKAAHAAVGGAGAGGAAAPPAAPPTVMPPGGAGGRE
jgi:tRNA (guanine9-N1)-methyltransferase